MYGRPISRCTCFHGNLRNTNIAKNICSAKFYSCTVLNKIKAGDNKYKNILTEITINAQAFMSE